MALRDYQKLCPNSGHALSSDEREKIAAGRRPVSLRCEACGQLVEARPDPGTGRSLLYSMHVRDTARPKDEGDPR